MIEIQKKSVSVIMYTFYCIISMLIMCVALSNIIYCIDIYVQALQQIDIGIASIICKWILYILLSLCIGMWPCLIFIATSSLIMITWSNVAIIKYDKN